MSVILNELMRYLFLLSRICQTALRTKLRKTEKIIKNKTKSMCYYTIEDLLSFLPRVSATNGRKVERSYK